MPKYRSKKRLGIRTCFIKLETENENKSIMQNKSNLRNTKDENIFINGQGCAEPNTNKAMEEKKTGKEVRIDIAMQNKTDEKKTRKYSMGKCLV